MTDKALKINTELTKFEDFNSIEEMSLWASKIIDSGLLPDAISEPEQVLSIVQHGKELGITPFVALNNIHIISGRPTLSSAMIGSLLKRRGIEWIWDEDFEPVKDEEGNIEMMSPEVPNRRSTIHFYWKSTVTDRVMEATHSITWVQMALAGYLTKDNWKKYPKEMMRARCLSYATRAMFPEVLSGFYTDIEMNDVAKDGITQDVEVTEEGDIQIKFKED